MDEEIQRKTPWFQNGTRLAIMFAAVNSLLVFANLYLSNGYVSKAAFETEQKETYQRREQLNMELRGIAVELRGILDHNQIDLRQEDRLKELERRMLEQEKRR